MDGMLYIANISVDTSFSRLGIGAAALMHAAKEHARPSELVALALAPFRTSR